MIKVRLRDADGVPHVSPSAPGGGFRFGVLGPLSVQREGVPVRLTGGRQRALLAVMLAVGGRLSRDRLIDELWGERPPASVVDDGRAGVDAGWEPPP